MIIDSPRFSEVGLVRIAKLLTRYVVEGDFWVPTTGSLPHWRCDYQPALILTNGSKSTAIFFNLISIRFRVWRVYNAVSRFRERRGENRDCLTYYNSCFLVDTPQETSRKQPFSELRPLILEPVLPKTFVTLSSVVVVSRQRARAKVNHFQSNSEFCGKENAADRKKLLLSSYFYHCRSSLSFPVVLSQAMISCLYHRIKNGCNPLSPACLPCTSFQ